MFFQATTLTCSHSFCQYCIEKWISTRASSLCPLCKAKIESKVHALVLDNTISMLVLKLPAEKQAERQQAIDERKGRQMSDIVIHSEGLNAESVKFIHSKNELRTFSTSQCL